MNYSAKLAQFQALTEEMRILGKERSGLIKQMKKWISDFSIAPEELFAKTTEEMKVSKEVAKKVSQADFLLRFWTDFLSKTKHPFLRKIAPRGANAIIISLGRVGINLQVRILENQIGLIFEARESHKYDFNKVRNQFIIKRPFEPQFENFYKKSWTASILSPYFNFKNGGYKLSHAWLEDELPKIRSTLTKFVSSEKFI